MCLDGYAKMIVLNCQNAPKKSSLKKLFLFTPLPVLGE